MQLILPKSRIPVGRLEMPLFFGAGPIRGGADWQAECFESLNRADPEEGTLALPCRYQREHPLHGLQLKPTQGFFPRQTLWERYYLHFASQLGCIIFWLPTPVDYIAESGHSYARDTRGELGEWRAHLMHQPNYRLVIGAEPDFPGLDVIKANFHDALGDSFPFYDTLAETVQAALAKAHH